MRQQSWPIRATLLSCLGLFLCVTAPAQTIQVGSKPADKARTKGALQSRLSASSKVAEEDVIKVLKALGPAVTESITNGESVEIPGLGVFRVVRIEAHKDLVDGRPATIAAQNYVEFVPASSINVAATSPKAIPATSVPGFEYVPLPNQVKGLRTENTRAPNTRTR